LQFEDWAPRVFGYAAFLLVSLCKTQRLENTTLFGQFSLNEPEIDKEHHGNSTSDYKRPFQVTEICYYNKGNDGKNPENPFKIGLLWGLVVRWAGFWCLGH
jgi:hypothetical protein